VQNYVKIMIMEHRTNPCVTVWDAANNPKASFQ